MYVDRCTFAMFARSPSLSHLASYHSGRVREPGVYRGVCVDFRRRCDEDGYLCVYLYG